jgi:hypothetical protein
MLKPWREEKLMLLFQIEKDKTHEGKTNIVQF